MIKRYRLIIALFYITVFISCQEEDKKIVIDNPTGAKIKIVIDDLPIQIDPYSEVNIVLKGPKHVLKINSKDEEFKLSEGDDFMLNPTKSTYIIEEVLYGENSWNIDPKITNVFREAKNSLRKRDNQKKLMLMDTIQVEQYKLVGLFEKTNSLVIPKSWEFGVLETTPEQITVKYNKPTTSEGKSLRKTINERMKDGTIPISAPEGKVKTHRKRDFLNEIIKREITSVNIK